MSSARTPAGLQVYFPESVRVTSFNLRMLVTEQQEVDREEDTSTNICVKKGHGLIKIPPSCPD